MTASFFEYLGWVSLSRNLKESFNRTLKGVIQRRHQQVEIEHLLAALVDDPEAAIELNAMKVDRERLREELIARVDELPHGPLSETQSPQPSRELKKLMAKASDLADQRRDDHIDGSDVVRALIDFEAVPAGRILQHLLPTRAGSGSRARAARQGEEPRVVLETLSHNPGPHSALALGFDVDPIRASIGAIMARRRDAEQILNQCEWYHLFKSLNMIEDGLEGDEQTHRAKLLARAERELAERPRCRKAFLYVQHLDQELARLKGIVDTDWADEFSPDEAVAELARLRQLPRHDEAPAADEAYPSFFSLAGEQAEIDRQLSNVKMQETEVLALEKQLEKLGRTAGKREMRIRELETQLQGYGERGRERGTAIEELERFLRLEVMQSEERERRIRELEAELLRVNALADELAAHRVEAGDRETLIQELDARLAGERRTAAAHETQIAEMRQLLAAEKARAEQHDRQMVAMRQILDQERGRAGHHEEQVRRLEADLKLRLEQLQAREEQIRILQDNLATQENRAMTREQQLKHLQAELADRDHRVRSKDEEVRKLEVGLATQEAEGRLQQQQINALRVALTSLETHYKQQEASFTAEKLVMEQAIDEMRRGMEESESLIEIVRGTNEPYRVSSDFANTPQGLVQIVARRTIPIAKPRPKS